MLLCVDNNEDNEDDDSDEVVLSSECLLSTI